MEVSRKPTGAVEWWSTRVLECWGDRALVERAAEGANSRAEAARTAASPAWAYSSIPMRTASATVRRNTRLEAVVWKRRTETSNLEPRTLSFELRTLDL